MGCASSGQAGGAVAVGVVPGPSTAGPGAPKHGAAKAGIAPGDGREAADVAADAREALKGSRATAEAADARRALGGGGATAGARQAPGGAEGSAGTAGGAQGVGSTAGLPLAEHRRTGPAAAAVEAAASEKPLVTAMEQTVAGVAETGALPKDASRMATQNPQLSSFNFAKSTGQRHAPKPGGATSSGAGGREKGQTAEAAHDLATLALEPVDLRHFLAKESLGEALRSQDVVLIKGSWLVLRADKGERLPRRQELPQGAAWGSEELLAGRLAELPVAAVSYCWLTQGDPDPDGRQLRTLGRAIDRLAEAKRSDVAVFIDWCSLFQEPRSAEEAASFRRSLRHAGTWYGHAATVKLLLTHVPTGYDALPYQQRGWPTFERAVSSLLAGQHSVYDLGRLSPADSGAAWSDIHKACRAGRPAPLTPDDFRSEVYTKAFSNQADRELLARKYEELFRAVTGGVTELSFHSCEWGAKEAGRLAKVLPRCSRLMRLIVTSNPLGDTEGAEQLVQALGNAAALEEASLYGCSLGPRAAQALAAVLPRCGRLKVLNVSENALGDAGCLRLAEAAAALRSLEALRMDSCFVSSKGVAKIRGIWAAGGKERGDLRI